MGSPLYFVGIVLFPSALAILHLKMPACGMILRSLFVKPDLLHAPAVIAKPGRRLSFQPFYIVPMDEGN